MNEHAQKVAIFTAYGFTVLAEKRQYISEFRIYEVAGEEPDGTLLYNRKGYSSLPDPVKTLAEAEVFAFGSIKWDGCSNWQFDDGGSMLHFCSRDQLLNVGKILAACWDWADPE